MDMSSNVAHPQPEWREDICWTCTRGCFLHGCAETWISISQKDVGQQWSLFHSLIVNGGRFSQMLCRQWKSRPLRDVIFIPRGKTRSTLPHINERTEESFVSLYQTNLCIDLQQEILSSDPDLNFLSICSQNTTYLVNSPFQFQLSFQNVIFKQGFFHEFDLQEGLWTENNGKNCSHPW